MVRRTDCKHHLKNEEIERKMKETGELIERHRCWQHLVQNNECPEDHEETCFEPK